MLRRAASSPLTSLLTPAYDMLLLLVISLLLAGVFVWLTQAPQKPPPVTSAEALGAAEQPSASPAELTARDRLNEQYDELVSKLADPAVLPSEQEIESLRSEREEAQAALKVAEERVHALDTRKEALEKEKDRVHAKGQELEELLEDLGERGQANAELRKQVEESRQRVAEIQSAARAGQARSVGSGVIWGLAEREPFYVFLFKGKLYPFHGEFYEITHDGCGRGGGRAETELRGTYARSRTAPRFGVHAHGVRSEVPYAQGDGPEVHGRPAHQRRFLRRVQESA